jgi:hypothetical protein
VDDAVSLAVRRKMEAARATLEAAWAAEQSGECTPEDRIVAYRAYQGVRKAYFGLVKMRAFSGE